TITATLHLNNDAAGNSFTNVVATATIDPPAGPSKPIAGPPTLTAPSALNVAAGGSVPLGVVVGAANSNDVLRVAISGVPRYESVTAAGATPIVTIQGSKPRSSTYTYTFNALPAADWNNGLILQSSYKGKGTPSSVLTVSVSDTTAGTTTPTTNITV